MKKQLKINKNSLAANAELMETVLNNWIKRNPVFPALSENLWNQAPKFPFTDIPSAAIHCTRVQIHSKYEENYEIYLVCGSALERLFKYINDESCCVCQCREIFDFSTFRIQHITKPKPKPKNNQITQAPKSKPIDFRPTKSPHWIF